MENIETGKIYRHFKGGHSLVLLVGKYYEGEELDVIYKGLNNGKIYVRALNSFNDIVENANGEQVPRFALDDTQETRKMLSEKDWKLIEQFKDFAEKTPELNK